MIRLKKILLIINAKSFAIAFLAVVSTLLCLRFDLTAEFPFSLITIAIVFPIVFSIGGAYKRREAALDEYGNIKAHGRSMYYAARDWFEIPVNDLEGAKKVYETSFGIEMTQSEMGPLPCRKPGSGNTALSPTSRTAKAIGSPCMRRNRMAVPGPRR